MGNFSERQWGFSVSAINGEVAAGLRRFDPRAGRVPLRQIWDHYAETKQPAVSVKTWSGYRQAWKLRIAPAFGNVPVNEISRSSVVNWLAQLTVGPWAKVSTLRLLRCVLEVAVADGRIAVNPAAGVSAPPIPPRERHRYLTAAEVNTLAAALGDQGDVALVLAYTGLRWSELVGLRVMDVDLDQVNRGGPGWDRTSDLPRVKRRGSQKQDV